MKDNKELNVLLDAMREMVLYVDILGVIQHANARAQIWRSHSPLVGLTFLDIADAWPDAFNQQREIMEVVRTQQPILGSVEKAVEADSECWFHIDKIPTKDDFDQVNGVMIVMSDITEDVRRERAIQESEARYRAFITSSSDAIWRYDIVPPVDIGLSLEQQVDLIVKRAVLAECNDKLVHLYGATSASELIGLPIYHNGSPDIRADITEFVNHRYRLDEREYEQTDSTGHGVFLQSNAIGMVENGFLTRVWGTTRNITDKCRYLTRLEYLANHDTLTSLPNRSVLYRTMEQALKQRDTKNQLALLLIDLDRFKEINDTLGHMAGDKVLKELGARLHKKCDESVLVTRLGGDEFAVFLPAIEGAQQALVTAYKLLETISHVFEIEGLRTEITASIGVAVCPDHANDVGTLMRFADVAMYRAKNSTQGVALYDASYDLHSPKRLELMGALGRAIRENELVLHYQPKIRLDTNQVYGFEALLRWRHPQLGLISPSEFVPISEHSSLIYPMTLWVLENGIKQCKAWLNQGYDISVAVNLSVRNLLDDRISRDIKRLLDEHEVPGNHLELEITESMIMADPARAKLSLDRIYKLGVHLSVDDFGTGYSSLGYLKRLPVQTLKIDSSFVRSMLAEEQDEIIVNSTIHLAHNLGLLVVAEGVESEWVYQKLQQLGCDSAQGHFMGFPMPVENATHWLQYSTWGRPCLTESAV